MKKYTYFVKHLVSVALILISNFSMAQSLTKIKDASISGTPTVAAAGAVLELESNNKGFLVPRMTTAQRDAIALSNRTDGLLIYNTTTGCFNHWKTLPTTGGVWLSICGTPPPAEFAISTAQCDKITINGTYTQGSTLTEGHFITIPVTVTQAGNYNVSATTGNGYFFEKSGNFPNAGNYTLNLPGTGTPNNATPGIEDVVSISLNGTLNTCQPTVEIIPADVKFALNCGTANVEGGYFIGISLTSTNKITVDVDVQAIGFWSINTGPNPINGMKFSGTGTFTTLGVQTIELQGSGTPIASGTNPFQLSSNSSTPSSCSAIDVTVANVAYTMTCGAATQNGNYMQAVALTAANTITLPINVTATGKTTISTNTVNGISFTSGPIDLTSLGEQNVTLTGTGTPVSPSSVTPTTLTVTGAPGAAAPCPINVSIAPQPVTYTMSCAGITTSGNYAPGIAMTSSNKMRLTVNATYGGAWSITSNTQNGVSFSGNGTLVAGSNTIELTANGTPTTGGSFTYTLTSNSASGTTTCSRTITFVFRTINILGLGGGIYQPASAPDTRAAKAILASNSNFGPNGTFPVQSLQIFNGGTTQNAATLKSSINTNKIDVIVVGYSYSASAAIQSVLIDFVKNKKGVLIYASESGDSEHAALVNGMFGGASAVTLTSLSTGSSNQFANPILNVDDPITNGPFGDVRGPNKYFGSDGSDDDWFENLPSTAIKIAHQNDVPTRVSMFRHPNLGYVDIANGGWLAGYAGNNSMTTYPCNINTTNVPIAKSYSGGTTIYNSVIYANTIAWAIKYAQVNTVVGYTLN